MAASLLVGTSSTSGANGTLNYWYLGKYEAVGAITGATEFRVESNVAGNVKVNVYADNAGEPGARLAYNDSAQAVAIGNNTLTVSAFDIVHGDMYWLGIISDTSGACVRDGSGGIIRYKASTYSTFTAPDPAGGSFTSNVYLLNVAVWGEAVMLPTIGYTAIGADPEMLNQIRVGKYSVTMPENGTAKRFWVRLVSQTGNAEQAYIGIYEDLAGVVGNILVGPLTIDVDTGFTTRWYHKDVNLAMSSGSKYYPALGYVIDDRVAMNVDYLGDAGDSAFSDLVGLVDDPALTSSAWRISMYIEYEAAAAAAGKPYYYYAQQ